MTLSEILVSTSSDRLKKVRDITSDHVRHLMWELEQEQHRLKIINERLRFLSKEVKKEFTE